MTTINGVETEWTLLQRKLGNLPPKEEEVKEDIPDKPTKQDKWNLLNYEGIQKNLDKAENLNDDEEQMLLAIKQKRMQEMKLQAEKDKFGSVQTIQANEYIAEVSQASATVPVVVHLYSEKEECKVLDKLLAVVAAKHKYVKFVRIKGCLAIPNFPDRNCPTLVIYDKGVNQGQIVGLSQFGGVNKATALSIELALAQMKIFKSVDVQDLVEEIEENLSRTKINYKKKKSRYDSEDEDSDDD